MRIIEITALSNGAHRNQSYPGFVPDGWAVVPDDMETPNFPFGEIEVADEEITETKTIDGKEVKEVVGTRKIVTKWTSGVLPAIKENEQPVSELEQLRADIDYIALMKGVDL